MACICGMWDVCLLWYALGMCEVCGVIYSVVCAIISEFS